MPEFVVYRITNTQNSFLYIGSTQDFSKRCKRHLRGLRNGSHHCILMQIDWTNQKGKGFTIKVIGRYKTRNDAYKHEFETIQKNLELGKCYNILVGGQGGDSLTFHPNKEEIRKKRAEYLARWRLSLKPDELKNIARNRKGSKNPNWRGGPKRCVCGTKICNNNVSCAKCQDKSGANNPFFGRTHSAETIRKIKAKNDGVLPPNTKRARINGVEYVSATEASRQLGIHVTVVVYRIKSKNPKFFQYEYV